MAYYSLNPKGRYQDEFKPVATTRVVASAPAQPAQTVSSPFRMQKRADGGTDFYNGNQKTTIEKYAQGTGNKTEAVRGYLANNGNKTEQAILTKQYYETKDPTVKQFNSSDIYGQRQKVADLKGLAGRTVFNTPEDVNNQKWAQNELAKIEYAGKNKSGNPITFVQDIAGATADNYNRVGSSIAGGIFGADNATVKGQQAQLEAAKAIEDVIASYQKRLSRSTDPRERSMLQSAIARNQGELDVANANANSASSQIQDRGDPAKIAGSFASVGLDVITGGAGAKLVKGGASTVSPGIVNGINRILAPSGIKQGVASGATIGAGYGVAGTASQLGKDATLTDYLKGAGTGALVGGVTGGAIPTVIGGGKAAGKALGIKSPTARMTDTMNIDVKAEQSARQLSDDLAAGDPTLQAALKKVQDNEAKIYELQSRGFKDNSPDVIRLRNEASQAENFAQSRFKTLSDTNYTKNLELERARLKTEQRASERAAGAKELQDVNQQVRELVPGGTLGAPIGKPKKTTQFEKTLQDAGIAPKAKSAFANQTVRRSKEVSDPLKAQVKSAEPTFQTVTDVERIAQSESYLKKSGINKATTDVKERLSAKQIDDQTVSDAIVVAKALDQKGNPANLLEASAIYEELSVKLSKAGQTVQAASLLNNRTPAGLQYGAIRALKKSGVEITDQMKRDISTLVELVRKTKPGSYEDGLARFKLQEYVSKNVPASNVSKVVQLWKAGLLTSPRTTAGNLAGNLAESVFNKGYVDPLANALDYVFSIFTGKASRSFTLRGLGSGTKEGLGKAVSYFKTGYDPRNPAQKFDVRQIHYSDKPLGKAAEAYTQTVFKLMGVADQPFYYANLRNSLYDQALTAATNKGLKGPEKKAFIKKFVTEPDAKTMQLADAEARYTVFQDETTLGKAASKIKNMDGVAGDIAEFVMPFTGVPSSIATRMIMRTPIGVAHEIVKQLRAKKFDQRAMTKAIANGSAAIPLIGAGSALAAAGQMTLGYPTDKKERDLWEAEGKQPYSIKVKNPVSGKEEWLSLNYFQPAGNLMAAGAEYQGALMDGKTPEEAFSQSLAGSGKAFSEQSFLKGVSSIGNAISDPSRFGQTFTESTAGGLVPNFIRTGARAFDPVKREVDNAGESIMAGIPGLRQNLDVKTNILGEDVQRNSSPLNELFNPTKPSDVQNKDNPIIQELRRLQDAGEGIVPTEATKSSLPDLDTKELRKVNKQVAQEVSSEWQSKILNDPRYELLVDSDKKKILDRVNDTVFGAIKTRQTQYKNGEPVDYFDGFDAAAEQAKKDAKAVKSTAKKGSTKKSGSAKKSRKDFKLFGFESADPETVGKNLRKLIEEAIA